MTAAAVRCQVPVNTATERSWLRTAGTTYGRTAVKCGSAVYTIAGEWLRSAAPPGMDVTSGSQRNSTTTRTTVVANCAATAAASLAHTRTHHKIA